MSSPLYLLAVDLGTTALKTCIYEVGESLALRGATSKRLSLDASPDGRAEQDPEEWWEALASSVPEVLLASGLGSAEIGGITFCAQMQCLVLADRGGKAVRPALSYLDSRATSRRAALTAAGPRIASVGLGLILPWMLIAGGVAASAKDPLWKYLRVMDEEPEAFARAHKWLDAKDFLTARCTGRFTMSADSAFATFLADTRGDQVRWCPWLVRRFGVGPEHLPEILQPSDEVGGLSPEAGLALGLPAGIPVFAGGGDASLIGVGAGAVAVGSTHVYVGTSGWVSTVSPRRMVDTETMMATVPGPMPGRYAYFGEQETSGKCLEWVRDHLALDEIGVYLEKRVRPSGPEEEDKSLVDYMTKMIAEVPVGSGGLLFAPWLHGSRSPFEDPYVKGMFFNLGLETGKRQMIRAVVEGLAYNKRMLLEAQERKIATSATLRFAGGGALSDETCRILADVTGRSVEPVEDPQNAGAAGAALVAACGLGRFADLDAAAATVRVRGRFEPNAANGAAHARNYEVFRDLYKVTNPLFHRLNEAAGSK
jgi:Sugar (pentulose and hexulose) kinases